MRAWLALASVWACAVGAAVASCSFSHRNLLTRQPLLLQPGGSRDARGFVRVDASGNVQLQTGEEIELACPGTNNYLQGSNVLPLPNVTAACQSSYTFTANGRTIALNQVECALEPLHEARPTGDARRCLPLLEHVEVGFALARGFLPLYEVCLDGAVLAPAGSRHYVVAGGRSTRAPSSVSAYLYTQLVPSKAYEQSTQVQSFTVQLGSTNANKYITYNNYLEYTLLTPLEDFVYGPQRMAVSFYLNSVPLWRQFMTGFWRTLESAVRDLARSEGDLLVETWATGVAQLPDAQAEPTPAFLHADANGTRLMPLPQFLVKSVENERGQQVIFVQIPPTTPARASMQVQALCEDVCGQLRWLPWREVPAASRRVACCRAGDELLRRLLPRASPFVGAGDLALASARSSAALLVGRAPDEAFSK